MNTLFILLWLISVIAFVVIVVKYLINKIKNKDKESKLFSKKDLKASICLGISVVSFVLMCVTFPDTPSVEGKDSKEASTVVTTKVVTTTEPTTKLPSTTKMITTEVASTTKRVTTTKKVTTTKTYVTTTSAPAAGTQEPTEKTYILNTEKGTYHTNDCHWLPDDKNSYTGTYEQVSNKASELGKTLKPCGHCNP